MDIYGTVGAYEYKYHLPYRIAGVLGDSLVAGFVHEELKTQWKNVLHAQEIKTAKYSSTLVTHASTEQIQQVLLSLTDDKYIFIPYISKKKVTPVTQTELLSAQNHSKTHFLVTRSTLYMYMHPKSHLEYKLPDENMVIEGKEHDVKDCVQMLSYLTGNTDKEEFFSIFGEELEKDFPFSDDWTRGVQKEFLDMAERYREALIALYVDGKTPETRKKFIAARKAYFIAQSLIKKWDNETKDEHKSKKSLQ